VGPCYYGMAHSQIADGDGLQIWRVTANVLNKHLQTADEGWSFSLGLAEGLTTHHRKKSACYEVSHKASELDRFWI
jgi:hypothetical protein